MFDLAAQFATMIAQNPQMAKDLDALGIPAPDLAGKAKFGGAFQPPMMLGAAGVPPPSGPDPWGATVTPAAAEAPSPTAEAPPAAPPPTAGAPPPAATPPPGQMDPKMLMALAGMSGAKAPPAVQPIMNGGVTGGAKAPEMGGKVSASSPAIQALMAALMPGGADPLRVPNLGAMMRK